MTGWIKMHRDIMKKDIFTDPVLYKIWAYILMSAEWKAGRQDICGGRQVVLERGQLFVKLRQAAGFNHVHRTTLTRCLTFLEKTGRIELKSEPKGTLITVINYDTYQGYDDIEDQSQSQTRAKPEPNQSQTRAKPEPNSDASTLKPLANSAPKKIRREEEKKTRREEVDRFPSPVAAAPLDHTVEPKIIVVNEQKPGAYAFDCFAKHYEARYGIRPLRDKMANVHSKAIAESIPKNDIDEFMECYLKNPNQYYVQKAHPLQIARADVQKIYTELLTGVRLSANKARQYETTSETMEAGNRWLAKVKGNQNG